MAMVGIWRGKSWGRNLSLALSAAVIILIARVQIKIFTILEASDFNGWNAFAYLGYFTLMAVFVLVFYVSLRPEVGRFCETYPREPVKT
jgi:hypothetical protein